MPVSWWDGEKYAKKRVVIDGELIDAHALEYGADSDDVAKRYHTQVIDTTLGPETCRFEFDQKASDRCQGPVYSCDKCGALSHIDETDKGKFKFCPNCGRKVKR